MCELEECSPGQPTPCNQCNFTFKSQKCFTNHKSPSKKSKTSKGGKSRCDLFKKCPQCNITLNQSNRKLEDHVCYETLCKFCHEYVTEDRHQCYQRCIRTGSLSTEYKIIFLDCETSSQDEDIHCTAGFAPGPDGVCADFHKVICGQNTSLSPL